jgi:rod shape determining protein RodA
MITRVELKERWLRLDWMVLLPAFLLLIISILFIYSAAYQREELNLQSLYRQQMLWVGVGAVVMLAAALVRGSFLEALCWPLYAGGLVLLAMVFVFGEEISGARRWLKLGILIQPSEFAKITTIVALAVFLSRRSARRGATILGAAAVTGIPFLMIASQPDLGSAAVLLPVVMSMLFVAGLPLRVLGLLLILGIVSMPLGWHLLRKSSSMPSRWRPGSPSRRRASWRISSSNAPARTALSAASSRAASRTSRTACRPPSWTSA